MCFRHSLGLHRNDDPDQFFLLSDGYLIEGQTILVLNLIQTDFQGGQGLGFVLECGQSVECHFASAGYFCADCSAYAAWNVYDSGYVAEGYAVRNAVVANPDGNRCSSLRASALCKNPGDIPLSASRDSLIFTTAVVPAAGGPE